MLAGNRDLECSGAGTETAADGRRVWSRPMINTHESYYWSSSGFTSPVAVGRPYESSVTLRELIILQSSYVSLALCSTSAVNRPMGRIPEREHTAESTASSTSRGGPISPWVARLT